jgi:Fe-S cluster assembly iron-binding protein IscA
MKVHATESALEELKRIMEQKEALDQTLRLYVSGFG